MAAEKKDKPKYRVNWRIHGLSKDPLDAGDVVELNDKDAAPLLECGVLTLIESEEG